MCFACTVIPMTISFGARAHVKHIERRDKALARGEAPPKFVTVTTLQTATAVAVVGLVVVAVLYHTTVAPAIGTG